MSSFKSPALNPWWTLPMALSVGLAFGGCIGTIGADGDSPGRGDDDQGNQDPSDPDFDPGTPDNVPIVNPDDPGNPADPKKVYGALKPVSASMMRLTHTQYRNTLTDIFGAEVLTTKALEADETAELFMSIGAAKVGTSQRGVEQFQEAAYDVATKIMGSRSSYPYLANCKPTQTTDACIDTFINTVGRRLFRRPLTGEELGRYKAVVTTEGAGRLEEGMRFALAGLLQSPNFLYLVNLGEADSVTNARRYTSLEMASRLSYFIWDSTPDEELLKAAEAGDLVDSGKARTQVGRLLGAPRARDLAARFLGEAWGVDDLSVEDKNTDLFKNWNLQLVDNYKQEFTLVTRDVSVDDPRDIREMLTTKRTFANAALATFYGASASGTTFDRIDLDEKRFGLLTSGAVVAANSPTDRTSPTHRGVFVVEKLLCREIPPPPDNVNPDLAVNSASNKDTPIRDILEQHRSDPACAGCHGLFDPAGLTFENFDPIGAYRSVDRGKEIDASGELDGRTFTGVGELAQYVKNNPEFGHCMTKQIYQYATTHEFTEGEEGVVDLAADRFASGGHMWKDLVGEVVTSAGFRLMASN